MTHPISEVFHATVSVVAGIGGFVTGKLPAGDGRLAGQAIWLVLVLLDAYPLFKGMFRKIVPDMLGWLVRPADALVSLVSYVLLLLDHAQGTALTKLKREPLYWFGQVVSDGAAAGHRAVSWLLPSLAKGAKEYQRLLAIAMLVISLVSWDRGSCSASGLTCTHPVEHWASQVTDRPAKPSDGKAR